MVVASVSSCSCAGDNGTGVNVVFSTDFLSQLSIPLRTSRWDFLKNSASSLSVRVLRASILATPIVSSIPSVVHRLVKLELHSELLSRTFFVFAELNRRGKHGVINVNVTLRATRVEGETEIRWNLHDQNPYALGDVIAVLVNHSSKYNFWRDNCYQYADNMFRTVVEKYSINVVQDEEVKARLQKVLDDHPRPDLPGDVLKKRYAAAAVGGSAVAAGGVATVAVVAWPFTLAAVLLAPEALAVTTVLTAAAPAIGIGCYVGKKALKCWKGARVSRQLLLRSALGVTRGIMP